MKYISTYLLVVAFGLFTAFSSIEDSESINKTFSFSKSDAAVPIIELILNEDNTFSLKDHSRPGKFVDVDGKYNLKGRVVQLYDFESEYSVASRWVIDEDSPCIRSRNVLNFTRICEED